MSAVHSTKKWWKEAVVYQVYPRSFYDSNGDGIGDLAGLTSKLDYLKDLGIDVIWICPMYKSPQDDNGYDISDYQDIHHEFGTMADFDRLLQEVHARGMRLILDLVVNHTSDEHPWFVESRKSKQSPKRDWYIWRDGKNGREPNNWESIFGGSAWKFDETSKQYFLHVFSARQPDLNWENREMRESIYKMIRWWMDKGIDGFRIDAITHMKKEPTFADLPNPLDLDYVPSYSSHMNYPGIQDYLHDFCRNTFEGRDIMTVGEANGVSVADADEWVGEAKKQLNMLIQFEHIGLWDHNPERRLDVLKLKEIFTKWQVGLEGRGWNALFVENHDVPRIVSKWGDTEKYWRESATSIAATYFLMQGTPFIYQGQEIGMTNSVFSSPQDYRDISALNTFANNRKHGVSDVETLHQLGPTSRDNARTPMQWSGAAHGGFSSGKPWIGVNPNYTKINVESQQGDASSVLSFYKKLIELRRENPVFIYGWYHLELAEHPQVYAYTRSLEAEKVLVLANLTGRPADLSLKVLEHSRLLLANGPTEPGNSSDLTLLPFEARVYRL